MSKYWKLVFSGADSSDIQGVNFREIIRSIAKTMKLTGFVKNRKSDGKVEVLLKEENKETVNKFCQNILEKSKDFNHVFQLDPNPVLEDPVEAEDDFFEVGNDFIIKQEDDLREMVWALKGAGKLFSAQIEIADEQRYLRLRKGLGFRLRSLHSRLGTPNKKLNLTFADHFLEEPPSSAPSGAIEKLTGLRDLLEEFNESVEEGKGKLATIIGEEIKSILLLLEEELPDENPESNGKSQTK